MVKLNLELDFSSRQRHFDTTESNQRRNKIMFREILQRVHNFFTTFGLNIESKIVEFNGEIPQLEFGVFQNDLSVPSVQFDCQLLREKLNMSENDYKIFEKIMSAHLRGIPKLHNSNDIKFQMNEIFPILSNELGVICKTQSLKSS